MSNDKVSPDVIICLGMTPNEDGSLGVILKNRVDLAYTLAKKYKATLILSGGKSHKRVIKPSLNESTAMFNYLKKNYDLLDLDIKLEKYGQSTIHQLCKIKKQLLLPQKWLKVGLVTDKIHLKRAKNTAEWIFGNRFSVVGFGSNLDIPTNAQKKYSTREKKKYQLSVGNFQKNFTKGDDKAILRYDKIYRKEMKKHIRNGGNPKDVLKIPGYY